MGCGYSGSGHGRGLGLCGAAFGGIGDDGDRIGEQSHQGERESVGSELPSNGHTVASVDVNHLVAIVGV